MKSAPFYLLDACALIAFFAKEKGYETVKNLLLSARKGEIVLGMPLINYGEVLYTLKQNISPPLFEEIFPLLSSELPLQYLNAQKKEVEEAAFYKARGGIAYPDAFLLVFAKKHNATIVTKDQEFQKYASEFQFLWM